MREIEQRFLITKEKFSSIKKVLKLKESQEFTQLFFIEKPNNQLQIRFNGTDWLLRLKSKVSNSIDEEFELKFAKTELESLIKLCNKFGYHKLFMISKSRYSTKINDVIFVLDHYLSPEIFVIEIELSGNEIKPNKLNELAKTFQLEKFKVQNLMDLKKQLFSQTSEHYNIADEQNFKELTARLKIISSTKSHK